MLFWVPSQVDIQDNEQANAANNTATQYLNIPIPASDLQTVDKEYQ